MELQIYFLRKLTFTVNLTFLRKFYTTKIWSYTVYNEGIEFEHLQSNVVDRDWNLANFSHSYLFTKIFTV